MVIFTLRPLTPGKDHLVPSGGGRRGLGGREADQDMGQKWNTCLAAH